MNKQPHVTDISSSFIIKEEEKDISFQHFYEHYFKNEIPVVIRGLVSDQQACLKWNSDYLFKLLNYRINNIKKDKFINYYRIKPDYQFDDINPPDILKKIFKSNTTYKPLRLRVWHHHANNLTPWHYDRYFLCIFYCQIRGRKLWELISPETPLMLYPFSYITVLKKKLFLKM